MRCALPPTDDPPRIRLLGRRSAPREEDQLNRRLLVAALAVLIVAGIVASTAPAANEGQLANVAALAGGGGHSLAIKKDGTLWAWGYNAHGQLGLGRAGTAVLKPAQVRNLRGVTAAAGGEFHTFALKRDGTVWGFGENDKGQLGLGKAGSAENLPVKVPGLRGVKVIDADSDYGLALMKDGTVRAWGDNAKGQLANGTTKDSTSPKPVPGLRGVTAIAGAGSFALALRGRGGPRGAQGTVYAWGENRYGQVGDGTFCDPGKSKNCNRESPVAVKGLRGKVVAIAGGQLGDYAMALMADGSVWTWGRNDQGQLGSGKQITSGCKCRATPARVKGVSGVKAIAASGGSGAALKSDGTVSVWGNNEFGQYGNGKKGGSSATAAKVKGLSQVKEIAAGGGYILALQPGGSVLGWGINSFGELGVGNTEHQARPVAVGSTLGKGGEGSAIPSGVLWLLAGAAIPLLYMLVARNRRRPAPAGWSPAAPFVPWTGEGAAAVPLYAPQTPAVRHPRAGETEVLDTAWLEYGRRVQLLARVDLFEGVSHDVLAQVATELKPLAVQARGTVSSEEDGDDRFFLVEAGTLAVTADVGGEPRELARLGPGEFFGEVALLGQGGGTGTVRAVTDAQLWTLSADDFQQLRLRHPEIDEVIRRGAGRRESVQQSGVFEVEQRSVAQLADEGQPITIGRTGDNEIVLASPQVSRHHAVIEADGDSRFRLRDLDSLNGTYVNGAPVRTVDLNDGDEIWVGDERFIFDRQAIRRSIEPQGIRLDATNLNRVVRGDKNLLDDISLSILPGEFVAIVGGSGAGKTTLMDALSGVQPATSGHVLYNGRDYYQHLGLFRNVLGYVPQDDIIHTGLPLRLTLRHAARLRLPPDTSAEDLDAAVDKALDELELTAQADLKVGLLSGGQRKRSSIGVELLTQPRIFFLDEPTSGLDPFTDAQMMGLLRHLADSGSTVTLTTHATKNVRLCDKVVFLARGGHLAFVGTPQRALRYFEADDFDIIYQRLAEEASPEEWSERFRGSEDYRQLVADQLRPAPADGDTKQPRSLAASGPPGGFARQLHQFAVLSRRGFDLFAKNPKDLPSLVMPPILFTLLALALFKSGAFEKTSNSAASLQIVFLIAFSSFIFGLLFAVQEIVKEFPIFRRERMVNVGIAPYVLSKTTFLAPLLTVLVLVMVGILRVTGRLPDSGLGVYWRLVLTLVLTGFVGLSLALLSSALVRTSQQATDMLSLWIMPQVLFGGALLSIVAMNAVGKVIAALAPVRWAFEGLGQIVDLNLQFRTDTSRIGPGLAIQYGDSFTRDPVQNWLILALFIVIPLILTGVVLRRKTTAR